MDIAIAVDSSKDISNVNWRNILNFVASFVGRFPKVSSAPDGTRFGVVSYATKARVYFDFKTAMDEKEVTTKIAQTPRQAGNVRRLDIALRLIESDLFSSVGGSRPGAQRVWFTKCCLSSPLSSTLSASSFFLHYSSLSSLAPPFPLSSFLSPLFFLSFVFSFVVFFTMFRSLLFYYHSPMFSFIYTLNLYFLSLFMQGLLVILTGPQDPNYMNLASIANKLRKNGIKLYAVGVSPSIRRDDVFGLADTKSDYISYARQYQGLAPLASPLGLAVQKSK